jgi:hypothetical protein
MNPAGLATLSRLQTTFGWKTFISISAGVLVLGGVFAVAGARGIHSHGQPYIASLGAWSGANNAKDPEIVTPLASLPPEAQASISAALGRDLPGYETRIREGRVETSNSRQKLAVSFTDRAVVLRRGRESWRIALLAYGYGTTLTPAVKATPIASLNRIEYHRGALTEWYVNGPVGLEQGFNFESRPGLSHGQPLTIALALQGSLAAAIDAGKTGLTLSNREGRAQLHYAGLLARDATGRKLPAWMEIRGAQLLLRTDDAQARYPVVIDPFVQAAELTASDATNKEEVGASVSISGNTVVAGAPGCSGCGFIGAAYVFTMPAGGWANMTQTAKLTASDGTANNQFGFAVSIDGNTIAVGAHGDNKSRGAVYVFVQPADGWIDTTETAKLTGSDSQSGDILGRSVSISGSTVVAGAPQATVGTVKDQGAAYLFVEPFAGWVNATETAKLTAAGGVKYGQLGYSVGIDGNTAVAGAPSPVPGKIASAGIAYLFVEPAAGWASMTQTAALTGSDSRLGDRLGNYVSVSGNTVVAGAPLNTPGSKLQQGAAYVFVEPFAGWANATQTAKLTSSDGVRKSYFGRSVSISGSQIVVGAPNETVDSNPGEGTVYEFDEPANGWADMTETAELDVTSGTVDEILGDRVSISGGTAVTGALGKNKEGMAFVFTDLE